MGAQLFLIISPSKVFAAGANYYGQLGLDNQYPNPSYSQGIWSLTQITMTNINKRAYKT